MMCMFCGNRGKCWDQMSDQMLEQQWVKCGYDDYVLDDEIDLDSLLEESTRRAQKRVQIEYGENAV